MEAIQQLQLQRSTSSASLFVKGLAKGCSERHMQTVFQQYGDVQDCQVSC